MRAKPPKLDQRVELRLTADELARWRGYAALLGVSMAQLARQAVQWVIDHGLEVPEREGSTLRQVAGKDVTLPDHLRLSGEELVAGVPAGDLDMGAVEAALRASGHRPEEEM